jgi:F-type H+-transporting ATPase subunit delta
MSTAAGYAAAFFEIARAEGALGTVSNELATFSKTFENNPQLQQSLTDQLIPVERRQTFVTDLLGGKASPVTVNLVSTLVGAGHAKDLPAVVSSLLERSANESGQEAGEVRSAFPLSDEQKSALQAAVAKKTGKNVALTIVVDPTVLGGVVTRVGDTVIDGSVKNRLEQLKAAV